MVSRNSSGFAVW